MAKILSYPDPLLRLKSSVVTNNDTSIKTLVKTLLKTIIPDPQEPQGVGLAAPQIGVLKRIFVMLMPDKKMEVIINPQIIKSSRKMLSDFSSNKQFLEGCLSVPGYYAFVNRPQKITVKYLTLSGLTKEKTLTPPFSSYFQHERDHLDGILFIDSLKSPEHQLYKVVKNKLKPVKNPFK